MSMRNCKKCGELIPQEVASCQYCGAKFTHRDCYPDQYQHPLCGKEVRVIIQTHKGRKEVARGTVERVVVSRMGILAHLDTSGGVAYRVVDCQRIMPENPGAGTPFTQDD